MNSEDIRETQLNRISQVGSSYYVIVNDRVKAISRFKDQAEFLLHRLSLGLEIEVDAWSI